MCGLKNNTGYCGSIIGTNTYENAMLDMVFVL